MEQLQGLMGSSFSEYDRQLVESIRNQNYATAKKLYLLGSNVNIKINKPIFDINSELITFNTCPLAECFNLYNSSHIHVCPCGECRKKKWMVFKI